jgi:chemotaxis protein histidine kinase CheA
MDKEIVEGFREESKQILNDLGAIVESLEDPQVGTFRQELSEFAQKIDRIMGAAKTLSLADPNHLGLQRIGKIAELCKVLGYRAAESGSAKLVPFFAAFWADTLDVVTEMIDSLEDVAECDRIATEFSSVVQKRLEWLANKLATTPVEGSALISSKNEAKDAINEILKDLGVSTK